MPAFVKTIKMVKLIASLYNSKSGLNGGISASISHSNVFESMTTSYRNYSEYLASSFQSGSVRIEVTAKRLFRKLWYVE